MTLSNHNFNMCRMIENTDSPTQGLSQLCDSRKQNAEDEFINLIHINIIQGLKDCREVLVLSFNSLLKWIMHSLSWKVIFFYRKAHMLS